jgi:AcrR family transcriptional regulator
MAHEAPQSPAEATDPRILRSRRMLIDALTRLLAKKEFEDISVQEIADEATLNRATFYLHYPDKGALLHALSDLRFRDLMDRRGISFSNCDGALRAIALGVCDYLTDISKCPAKRVRNTLDGAVISVVEGMFKEGLANHGTARGADTELLATTAAWAIFGAARNWYQTPDRIPAEEMAVKIETMVKPVFLAAADS